MYVDTPTLIFLFVIVLMIMGMLVSQINENRKTFRRQRLSDLRLIDTLSELEVAKLEVRSLNDQLRKVTVSPAHVENIKIDSSIKTKQENEW